ncbi:peroxisome biosynthesis (peroxine-7) protein [Rutstroemia sp. NJR-2017a BBW]|nr:peroxisome biosynthesis (peroxine-7) protein [Rutstroemia sp. NJR-2017a BBW]
MLEFRTQGFNGYAVKYSPFYDSRICVAAAANYGLVGNGRLYSLMLTPKGIQVEKTFDTQDSMYDLAWSEANENQVITACGDGSIKLFDISLSQFPVQNWQEHGREVYSWSPSRPDSILTLPTHSCTYSSAFSPHSPSIISSVSSDSHLRIFDLRTPASASNHLTTLIPIHGSPVTSTPSPIGSNRTTFPPSECLTHDWNKYRSTILATAGVDQMIRIFDLRNPSGPVALLRGHDYASVESAFERYLAECQLRYDV